MGLLDLIANTYHDIGQQKLDAGLRSGQIWGNALASLGQIPGQIQQQKMQDQQIQTSQLQNQVTQAQLTGLQQAQAGQAKADAILADPAVRNPDGTFNTDVLTQKLSAAGVSPTVQANYLKALDEINTSTTKTHEARLNHAGDIANAALQGHDASNPMTPEEAQLVLATAVASGAATKDEIAPFTQQLANGADPTKLFQSVKSFAPKYGGPAKFTAVGPNGVLNESTQQVIGGEPKSATAAEQEVDAQKLGTKDETPTSRYSAAAVAARAAAKAKEGPKTEFDVFRDAVAPKLTGDPASKWTDLTPDQQLAAIKQFKTITTDQSAAAATERLASTQAATNARLDKTENFQEAEKGRGELDKAEDTLGKAQSQSQTFRDVVSAAKAGNKYAASQQALEGALTTIRDAGLSRINQTEIGASAGAGSLWDKIQGWVGKQATGEPIPPEIQDAMLQYADILEKGAYQQYSDKFDRTVKRYPLPQEQKKPAPQSPFTHQPIPGNPGKFASSTDGGKTWKVDGGG